MPISDDEGIIAGDTNEDYFFDETDFILPNVKAIDLSINVVTKTDVVRIVDDFFSSNDDHHHDDEWELLV